MKSLSIHPDTVQSDISKAEERNGSLEDVTLSFYGKKKGNYTFSDIAKIGEIINAQKGLKKVSIILRSFSIQTPLSAENYASVCLLLQAIRNHLQEKKCIVDVKLGMEDHTPLEDVATFLRLSDSTINRLHIYPRGESLETDGCAEVARAIASLDKLQELWVGRYSYQPNFTRDLLGECIHTNKLRLKKLSLQSPNFDAFKLNEFLASGCASNLRTLTLQPPSFTRIDAIALQLGLVQNHTVTSLVLEVPEAAEGLPIFSEYLRTESSIEYLVIYALGGTPVGNWGLILSALESKPRMKELRLVGSIGRRDGDGGLLRQVVSQNRSLQLLEIVPYPEAFEGSQFLQDLAEGLRTNRSLRSLSLGLIYDYLHPFVDISSIIQAISNGNGPNQLEVLKLTLCDCPPTPSTWSAITSYVRQLQFPLKLLKLDFGGGRQDDILGLIGAIKSTSNLERADLDLSKELEDVDLDWLEICTEALGTASFNLSHLSLRLPYRFIINPEDDEEREETQEALLALMEANTNLESVKIIPSFELLKISQSIEERFLPFCTRNKATKAAARLEDGTLDPVALPPILEDIEWDCRLLGASTDLHFINIWFSLLMSRPLEVEQFCFP